MEVRGSPFTDFGNSVYQPQQPINLTYDTFGPPAALIRGLFEYLYRADGLTLFPHIPPTISELQQVDPIRFGNKRLYISTAGRGMITSVTVNGRPSGTFDGRSVFLPYDKTPEVAQIMISLGGGTLSKPSSSEPANSSRKTAARAAAEQVSPALATLDARAAKLRAFHDRLITAGLGASYEAADTKLVISHLIGKRDAATAFYLISDLKDRLVHRVQLTTDGFRPYLMAVEDNFGADVDYAMLVKVYGTEEREEGAPEWYGLPRVIAAMPTRITGKPHPRYISTSYIERQNLTIRMQARRFTRLTNAFSKKLSNLKAQVTLHFAAYNFLRIHETLRMTPAMAAGITDHLWEWEELTG